MSTHILTILRQFVISRVLKAMPLRTLELKKAEPKRRYYSVDEDLWMFDAPRPVSSYVADVASEMSSLSDTVGQLRAVVSRISMATPIMPERQSVTALQSTIWSDEFLFDGEPAATTEPALAISDEADFLFEDDCPVTEMDVAIMAKSKTYALRDRLMDKRL